jgi:ribosomal protein S27AE
MATPKGMRAVQLAVNATDAVHVYSNDQHIWIQLRRAVPTEHDIGTPSFKTALCLAPDTAHKLGLELLKLAERNKDKQKSKTAASPSGAAKQSPAKPKAPQKDVAICPRCRTTPTIEHDGRQWCSNCGAFTTGRTSYPPPPAKAKKPSKKKVVVDLISNARNT